MRETLLQISKGYMTPDKIRREVEKGHPLDYDEYLEGAYENIQSEAATAVKGVKKIDPDKPEVIRGKYRKSWGKTTKSTL